MKTKLSLLAIASIALIASTGSNARLDNLNLQIDANPAQQIETQISTIKTQIDLIQTSLMSVPRNVVTGPIVSMNIDEAIGPIMEKMDTLGENVEASLSSSLEEFEGQYKNVAIPNKITAGYLEKLPKPRGNQEFQCLAEALYFEARGESLQGQRAVAEVILNRVDSKRYPDTICGVVNQGTGKIHRCQFSYTCDGIPEVVREPKAYTRGAKIARLMIDGLYKNKQLTGGALFYHTTGVNPNWASQMTRTSQIGVHLFYR